jgi:superfamily I DNA and/or RNA helicase
LNSNCIFALKKLTENPHIAHLIECIDLEIQEQEKRYQFDENSGLKQLKAMGVVLHPLSITRKTFGYADYPEISFRLPYLSDTSNFRDNSAIECFIDGEESVKGVLLRMDGQKGEFRLFAPDFPDWIEDKGVGIKLAPDHFTSETMKKAVKNITAQKEVEMLFECIHGKASFGIKSGANVTIDFQNKTLNESQQLAVKGIVYNDNLAIVHGPPGTGKTTTLIEAIVQSVKLGKRILVTASSNTAVDNVAKGLLDKEIDILRVGNTLKVDDDIFSSTPEGKMQEAKELKEIKKLKIRAEEMRKMSYQYKRSFGKAEREQRNALIKEVKRLRKEIRDIQDYFDEKLFDNAEVILGTPIGLKNALPATSDFDILFIDEAGQMIEPMAWVVIPFAKTWVLAGDPFQLPPTVLSDQAARKGFNISILERSFKNCKNIYFLNTQYRMRKAIADFSSRYFYQNELKTPENQQNVGTHFTFFDTAGTGFDEQSGADGVSLMNQGELDIVNNIIETEKLDTRNLAFISPYNGQVQLAKEQLSSKIRISTIDSFQGQEKEIVILSLVRSNTEATIGFLKDYRRMNVALTRAKEQLFVIGDSSTIGQDPFYALFLEYLDEIGGYRSAWELMG